MSSAWGLGLPCRPTAEKGSPGGVGPQKLAPVSKGKQGSTKENRKQKSVLVAMAPGQGCVGRRGWGSLGEGSGAEGRKLWWPGKGQE